METYEQYKKYYNLEVAIKEVEEHSSERKNKIIDIEKHINDIKTDITKHHDSIKKINASIEKLRKT